MSVSKTSFPICWEIHVDSSPFTRSRVTGLPWYLWRSLKPKWWGTNWASRIPITSFNASEIGCLETSKSLARALKGSAKRNQTRKTLIFSSGLSLNGLVVDFLNLKFTSYFNFTNKIVFKRTYFNLLARLIISSLFKPKKVTHSPCDIESTSCLQTRKQFIHYQWT